MQLAAHQAAARQGKCRYATRLQLQESMPAHSPPGKHCCLPSTAAGKALLCKKRWHMPLRHLALA